ncbi:thrombospondin-2-like [Mizuhopecten yessoensis]|uniref:thrombospondin-2-like n=1 Tax=Mizuhopecten yessoensis TaxID=6573 RepID=UPI000B45CC1B|nr:thrombospondin-2-like [Mizuhopecten yessoensis]
MRISGILDGGWSQWSSYGGCSATCGEGVQERIRSCNNPTPLNGGFICAGSNIYRRICNERTCPIDGSWSLWIPDGRCSVTCEKGIQNKKRLCNNPTPHFGGSACAGRNETVGFCNEGPCPIDGSWSLWISDGPCSATCGEGVQAKKRLCNNPTPQYGGSACAGSNKDVGFCKERPCPKTWNDSCLMNSDCTDHLVCNDRYNTCDCMRVTDVWDPVHMICLSSLEFLAIYSPERLDFASATKNCTNNMTGFLATRDFMNNMFLTCMDTNHDIWLANTIETTSTNDGGINFYDVLNKLSKGGKTSGSINTELEVRYNNTATPVADQEDPDHLSHGKAGPAIETDHYGYGILGKTSGAERNPVGIDDDDFYSHTNTNQPFGSEYDVFERKKENRDESGIYDHTKPGMEEGQYDEFQDPKSSCVYNDDFIYNTDTDELP